MTKKVNKNGMMMITVIIINVEKFRRVGEQITAIYGPQAHVMLPILISLLSYLFYVRT